MKIGIYDPFVGLGTILIEAAHSGYTQLLGSDKNHAMVEVTHDNVSAYAQTLQAELDLLVEHKDARTLSETAWNMQAYTIVTEGYLGKMFQKSHLTSDRVGKERDFLT